MLKRFGCMLVCLAFSLIIPVSVYSQTSPSSDLEKAIEDSPTDTVGKPMKGKGSSGSAGAVSSSSAAIATTTSSAKLFYDGANIYANPKVKFKLTVDDSVMLDKIIYKIDDSVEQDYTGEFNLSGEGKHVIEYYGVDKVGNLEPKKYYNIILDETGPEITVTPEVPIVIVGGNYYTTKNNTFTISGKDNISGYNNSKYSLNGTDYFQYASGFKFTAEGDVQFKVLSEDNVGNQTETFKIALPDASGVVTFEEKTAMSFLVDNVAPAVTITPEKEFIDVAGKKITGQDNKYTVAATDEQSGLKMIYVKVDGKGAFAPYDKEIMFNTNGDHFIEAKAVDNCGNESDVVTLGVFVKVIPPKSTIDTVVEETPIP